jgi:hypothetical protein
MVPLTVGVASNRFFTDPLGSKLNMLKKTAIAASVTVALATASLPASSAIFAAAEGLLVPVFVAELEIGGMNGGAGGFRDTEVRVSIPASIGFDGLINNFTAPNTTPTNPNAALSPRMKSFTDPDGYMRPQDIAWYWFDQYSGKVIDGTRKVTPDDVEIIRAKDILPPIWWDEPGYLVIASAGSAPNAGAKGASMVMFGDARIEVSDDVDNAGADSDWVNLPVLGLTDGPDNGLVMPTKIDNIKFPTLGAPVVSPLVTGMRTNVSNGKLGATTVFEMPIAPAAVGPGGAWTDNIHVVWLDMNRFDMTDLFLEACLAGSPARLGGYIYDSDEDRQSWGGCLPWELNIVHFDTDDIDDAFPDVDLSGGGFIQYQLPEYYDAPGVLGPQTSGIAFSINEVADDDFVTTLANERGMFNEGCGVLDPTCANNYNSK